MDPGIPPWVDEPEQAPLILHSAAQGDDDPEDGDGQSPAGRWHIDGPGSAEWAMAHLAAATAVRQATQDQYDLWRDKLDGWLRAQLREPDRTIAFFTDRLQEFGVAVRQADPDGSKTLRFASGEIATRRDGRKIVVTDDDAFCRWALNAFLPLVDEDGGLGLARTYADVGVVKTTYKAMISRIRDVINLEACASCEGTGVVAEEHEHGAKELLGCPDCQGDGYVALAAVVGLEGTVVLQAPPGLGVEPETYTATAKPRPLGLTVGGAR